MCGCVIVFDSLSPQPGPGTKWTGDSGRRVYHLNGKTKKSFSLIWPLVLVSHRVAMSVCLGVSFSLIEYYAQTVKVSVFR